MRPGGVLCNIPSFSYTARLRLISKLVGANEGVVFRHGLVAVELLAIIVFKTLANDVMYTEKPRWVGGGKRAEHA